MHIYVSKFDGVAISDIGNNDKNSKIFYFVHYYEYVAVTVNEVTHVPKYHAIEPSGDIKLSPYAFII
jgi:hypothetical protein